MSWLIQLLWPLKAGSSNQTYTVIVTVLVSANIFTLTSGMDIRRIGMAQWGRVGWPSGGEVWLCWRLGVAKWGGGGVAKWGKVGCG